MSRHLRACAPIVLVIGALLWAAPALAGDGGQEPLPAEQRTFTLAPAIWLTDAGIDTNIMALPAADDPRRDATMRLTLQSEPVAHLGRVTLRGRASVGTAYFREYTQLRSVDTDNLGRIDVRINRITFYGSGSVLLSSDVFGPELDVRTRRTQSAVEGGGDIRVSTRTRLTLGARHEQIDFDEADVLFDANLRDELTRGVDTLLVQVRNKVTPLTTVAILGDIQRDQFRYVEGRDTTSVRLVAGFETKPSAVISGKAFAGYRLFRPADAAIASIGTLAAAVDVTYTLVEATRFGLHVNRDLGNSYSATEPYYLVTDVLGTVTQRLTPTWDITAMAGRQFLSYPWSVATPGSAPSSASDRYLRFGAGVVARIGRTSTFTVNAESYHRDSTLTGYTYDRLRVVSSLGVRF